MAIYDFYSNKGTSSIGKYLFHDVQFNKLIDEVKSSVKGRKSISVLEIGTGEGNLADRVVEENWAYTGYEPADSLYKKAIKKGLNVKKKYIPPLDEENKSFDVVVLNHVMEHFKDYTVVYAVLEEIYRVLKDDGICICIYPDIVDYGGDFWNADFTHTFPASLYNTIKIIEDCKFTVQKKKYLYGVLDFFPGYFCNRIMKILFCLGDPLIELLQIRYYKVFKLKVMFSRNIQLTFLKR